MPLQLDFGCHVGARLNPQHTFSNQGIAGSESLGGLAANGDLQDRVRGQLAAMLQVSESHAHVRHTQQAV